MLDGFSFQSVFHDCEIVLVLQKNFRLNQYAQRKCHTRWLYKLVHLTYYLYIILVRPYLEDDNLYIHIQHMKLMLF